MVRKHTRDIIVGGTSVSYKSCDKSIKTEGFGLDDIYECSITGEYCEDPFFEKGRKKDCPVLKKDLASKTIESN